MTKKIAPGLIQPPTTSRLRFLLALRLVSLLLYFALLTFSIMQHQQRGVIVLITAVVILNVVLGSLHTMSTIRELRRRRLAETRESLRRRS